MKIINLKTLHRKNPLGIDRNPYFSWMMESKEKNIIQSSYRIVVSENENIVWDTGIVESQQQSFIEYEGEQLQSCRQYRWEVTIQDNKSNISKAKSFFETAFLDASDWKAKWIESTIPREEKKWEYGLQPPAVWFSKNFIVEGKISKARLYASSYGVYRILINEKRPDDREFAPEHTVYRNILYYQTYDVTEILKSGENNLSMYVGDGWYLCPQTAPIMKDFHGMPAVLFQLELEFEDGLKQTVISDGDVQCFTGSVQFSDLFFGEKQDATVPLGVKQTVKIVDFGYQNLYAQPMSPIRPVKLLPATQIYTSPAGETIVDFGQVISGRSRIHIDSPKGTEIIFEYFEVTDENGNYFNSMYVPQKDIYVSDGKTCEYEALFTFHGFRYIRVSGLDNLKKEDCTAVVLSTEKENLGTFECSDERLNRLYQNIRWSQTNNMMSVPTDCPTREKAGFTGDIQIYAKTALINEDVTPLLTSYLQNLAADQMEDGVIPMVVPFTRLYEKLSYKVAADFGETKITGIAGWSDAAVIVPYIMYKVTGNILILKENYETMKRWCDYVIRTAKEKRGNTNLPEEIDQYLWNTGFHFGEWLIPSQPLPIDGFETCKISASYTAPFYGFLSVHTMAKIASILGNDAADYYFDIAEKIKLAIQKGIMKDGKMLVDFMGAYVLAIAFDLVPEEYKDSFEENLVSLLEKNEYRLDTGFLATPFLLDSLVKIGRRDLAEKVLWQDSQPSWLYQIDHGATTIWEDWRAISPEGKPERVSFDHYAYGCVDDWIFRNIAGINIGKPGFKHIIINPLSTGQLEWCRRTYLSEFGEISVYWTKDVIEATIPCNTTASIIWKGKTHEVGSGKYTF